MNDIVLSALLNLFALIGADAKLDREKSLEIIIYYLKRYFTVLDRSQYIDFYTELRDFYADFPVEDIDSMVGNICSKLQGQIPKDEQALMLLRLMEFSNFGERSLNEDNKVIKAVADAFNVSENLYSDFFNFIQENPDAENVLVLPLENGAGKLKTLFVESFNALIFTYIGDRDVSMYDAPVGNFYHIWIQSGVLKCKDFSPLYYSSIMKLYGRDRSEKAVTLSGREVDFRFQEGGTNGLHNFSFDLHGGELVAIMGGSGVGKSTLMSLLIGNLVPQKGAITLNGHNISDQEVKSAIGFVPQDDLLIEELTVYQNLWYTAKLCFDGMSDEKVDEKVMSVLTQLELEAAKDLKVGSPIKKYISGGQRKRLNIAMELIREPSVIFLDEPTSGLSSSDTEKVINILKSLTCKGKLIVANIHQPSSDVYKLFDRLWLLDVGGYPVFDGNPIDAISYFKNAANYADADVSACKTCGTVRPETVLNIINEKSLDAVGKMTERRRVTPKEWHDLYVENRGDYSAVDRTEIPPTDQSRPAALKQIGIFLRRNVSTKLSNLQYILVTMLEAPLLAVICGLLTHYTPDGGVYTLMDNKNLVTYFFMAVIVAVFLGMSGSAEEIIRDRTLLKREKFLNLSYGSYISSKLIYMAMVCLIQTLLFIIIGNSILGIHGMFFVWWMILFVSAFLSSMIGLLLSQCLSSVVAIYISIPLLLIPQILLCGLVVDFDDLNPNSETGNVPVIGSVIPSRWAFEALAVANFSMNEFEKPFYQLEREKYSCIYYEQAFLYELESQLETHNEKIGKGEQAEKHMDVIRTELPKLARVCKMEKYAGDYSYASLTDYFAKAHDALSSRGNKLTIAMDRETNRIIKQMGQDEYFRLKSDNFNSQLENLVVNRNAEKSCVIRGNHIVPRTGYVFLTPDSRTGRAPFYSGVKVVGKYWIPTLWFNTYVLLLMCGILAVCLYSDIPGKFVREEKN